MNRPVSPRLRGTTHAIGLPLLLCVLIFGGGVVTGFLLACFFFFNVVAINLPTQNNNNPNPLVTLGPMLRAVPPANSEEVWKTIHVFVGNHHHHQSQQQHIVGASTIPNDYYQQVQWYSQLRQDYIVYRLLHNKTGGYFVDLAANDAIRLSNTFALEHHHDWSGICIEPHSIYWGSLAYRSSNCTVVGAVVGRQRMEPVTFHFRKTKGPQSGIVFLEQQPQQSVPPPAAAVQQQEQEHQPRFTITLTEILDRFGAPNVIDYLSLDVEGAESLVLHHDFAFHRYQFQVMTIERPDEQLQKLLEQHGYLFLQELRGWGETLWVHRSAQIDRTVLDSLDIPKYSERVNVDRSQPQQQRNQEKRKP